MKRLMIGCLVVALAATCFSAGLRVGAAKGNITPNVGAVPFGEWNPVPSTNIHDDLWVRCMAFDDGQTRIALVVCDLLGIADPAAWEIRRLVEAETGVPGGNVMVSCTHTHSAPSVLGDQYVLDKPPVLNEYQQMVVRRAVDTVRCAFNNLEPAQVGWTTAQVPEHVFNRRWFLKPGTMPVNPFGSSDDKVKMNPPVGSPNLDRPAGPTDPEVYVLAARRPNGTPIATFSNYALHYVGGKPGTDISADYYGVFNDRVQELLNADRQDPPFVSIMSNGASGDINSTDRVNPAPAMKPYEKIRYVAENVAQKVATAYRSIEWRDKAKIGAAFAELELEFRHPTPEMINYAKGIIAGMTEGQKPTKLPEIYAHRIMNTHTRMPAKGMLPLQAFRIGDLGIATFPMEVFCEIGLDVKKRSPFKAAFPISLAHGYYGYMPTPEQIPLGGYETWIGTNCLEPQAAPKIVERLLAMQNKLMDN